MKNIYILILFCCSINTTMRAQSNTPCGGGGAPSLSVNTSCSFTTGSTVGATQQTNAANFGTPSCGLIGEDVWYSFTAPASGDVTITTASGSISDGVMSLYDSDCVSATELACSDDVNGLMPEISNSSLTPGTVYYIRFWEFGGGSGTFDICIVDNALGGTGPSNDLCANATALPCGTLGLAGTTVAATVLSHGSGCTLSDEGVWYTFTGNGQLTTIEVTTTAYDVEMAIASGVCGALSNVACVDGAGSIGTESYTFLSTLGLDYYVYVAYYSTFFPSTGTFTISNTCSAPITNDNCSGAIPLTVNPDLSCANVTAGTVFGATASTDPTATSCFGTADDDVWFSFVATSTSHNLSLTNVAGSVTDMYHSVYDMGGGCPALGTEIICSDNDNSSLNGLTIGTTYYVRVYTYTSLGGQNTTFDVCISTPVPCAGGAGGNDCAQQQPICTDNTYCYTAGVGSIATAGNDYGCLITQPNPSWYYFEISTAGNLVFDLGAGSDIDFAVWGPFANAAAAAAACGSLAAPIDCSFSPSPTEQANITGVVPGEVYIMVVTNYAAVVQDITLGVSGGNTASTNCAIVNPTPCAADAGNW